MPSKKAKREQQREQRQRLAQRVVKAYDAIVANSPRIGDDELLAALRETCWDGLFPLSEREIINALADSEGRYGREAQKLERLLASKMAGERTS